MPTPDPATFAGRLQLAAEHARVPYSQSAIGNALGGVDRRTVDRWFSTGLPNPEMLFKIADTFKVDARWLASGQGDMVTAAAPEPAKAPTLPKEAQDIALAWLRLTPVRQHAIREWVFLESVLAEHYPWLLPGRPTGQSYADYEKAVENDIIRITKHLMMQKDGGAK